MSKPLRDSHFMPRGMYKRIRDPSKRNASPVVVTRERTTKTFRQTKAYVLCADCEQRFNLYGEDWMLKKLGAGKRFPLRERLDVAIPMSTGPEVKKYSCVKAGIDSEKLGYFALSMLWRGAIHEWQDPLGSPIPKLDLGDMEEPMRRYLLGDGPFPDGIVVIVRVCDDSMSRETLINPIPAGGVGHYEMLTLGVQFEMFVGAAIDPQCRELCCVSSTDKWIFRRNCRKRTLGHYVALERTSQRSKQVIAEWPD